MDIGDPCLCIPLRKARALRHDLADVSDVFGGSGSERLTFMKMRLTSPTSLLEVRSSASAPAAVPADPSAGAEASRRKSESTK